MGPTWKTALVTGASTGIGESFSRRLADEGTDLVITARDEARLTALADALRSGAGVEVEVLPADLADPAGREIVEARVGDPSRPVDLLVNNAGFGSNGRFHELDVDTEEAEVAVNVLAVQRLTHAAVKAMLERGAGTVLNVSSLASRTTSPANATYAATKAFVSSFSESLYEDLRDEPVTVCVLEPGYTKTEFQERAGLTEDAGMPGFVWMSPDEVAAIGLDGARDGKPVIIPGVGYKAVSGAAGLLPRGLRRRLIGIMARRF